MKNFDIIGVHWKFQFLGEASQETNIEGGLSKKGGLDSLKIWRFKGDLTRKNGVVFLRGQGVGGFDTPMYTLSIINTEQTSHSVHWSITPPQK